MLDFEKLIT